MLVCVRALRASLVMWCASSRLLCALHAVKTGAQLSKHLLCSLHTIGGTVCVCVSGVLGCRGGCSLFAYDGRLQSVDGPHEARMLALPFAQATVKPTPQEQTITSVRPPKSFCNVASCMRGKRVDRLTHPTHLHHGHSIRWQTGAQRSRTLAVHTSTGSWRDGWLHRCATRPTGLCWGFPLGTHRDR